MNIHLLGADGARVGDFVAVGTTEGYKVGLRVGEENLGVGMRVGSKVGIDGMVVAVGDGVGETLANVGLLVGRPDG